jgi:hypothetical protein
MKMRQVSAGVLTPPMNRIVSASDWKSHQRSKSLDAVGRRISRAVSIVGPGA